MSQQAQQQQNEDTAEGEDDGNNTNDDIDANREWEERYRRPITRELWTEFQNEGQRTRNYLSSPSSSWPMTVTSIRASLAIFLPATNI